jgi:thiol-disulfide isomerase/thioredoxin
MRLLILACVFLAVAGCRPSDQAQSGGNAASPDSGASDVTAPVKGVDRSHKGQPAPNVTIVNPDGGKIAMAAFKGVPTLINFWASWCAPCVKELPTLDALAARYVIGGELGVIAVSQDNAPQSSVVAFLDKLKVKHLGAFQDPQMALSGALGVEVMPTTVFYDAEGKEVWRYVGDLDWTSREATKLLAEAAPAPSTN